MTQNILWRIMSLRMWCSSLRMTDPLVVRVQIVRERRTKLIDEFVKDALFLEISGCETESSNQEEAKINGWLESQVITDEVSPHREDCVGDLMGYSSENGEGGCGPIT
ncbi:hypothetical protein TCAL_04644 [Tigriopus californicus]|uniref:Uncharacterized protein n=1 Tax=Tigriopus californicus TaxID=6832 RepID=A0A553NFM8_TIGCA|nr:hypothetical protein TCAL_04644 [Tigriopus californicus]